MTSLNAYAPGLSRLTHLTVPSTDFAGSAVPWDTLQHLNFSRSNGWRNFEDEDDEDESDFVVSLKNVCERSVCCQSPAFVRGLALTSRRVLQTIPLRSLALHISPINFKNLLEISQIVRVIRAPSLTDLALLGITSLAVFNFVVFGEPLRSVLHLKLGGSSECLSSVNSVLP